MNRNDVDIPKFFPWEQCIFYDHLGKNKGLRERHLPDQDYHVIRLIIWVRAFLPETTVACSNIYLDKPGLAISA